MANQIAQELPRFIWVNTALCNLKTMINGAHKAIKFSKYATAYLGAFAYLFNRRFDPASTLVRRVLCSVGGFYWQASTAIT